MSNTLKRLLTSTSSSLHSFKRKPEEDKTLKRHQAIKHRLSTTNQVTSSKDAKKKRSSREDGRSGSISSMLGVCKKLFIAAKKG